MLRKFGRREMVIGSLGMIVGCLFAIPYDKRVSKPYRAWDLAADRGDYTVALDVTELAPMLSREAFEQAKKDALTSARRLERHGAFDGMTLSIEELESLIADAKFPE